MPTIPVKIWLAVKARVLTAPGGLPIAWPAAVFDPEGKPFIAVQLIRIAPVRLGIGSDDPHQHRMTLQLMTMHPVGSQPIEVTDETAGLIGAHFPTDLRMTYDDVTARVMEQAHVSDGFREGAWWQTPVRVRIESHL